MVGICCVEPKENENTKGRKKERRFYAFHNFMLFLKFYPF
jgi:hypothetical protein